MDVEQINPELMTKEKTDSVEISVNAKGQFAGKVKVYAETIEESYVKALEYVAKLETLIKEKNRV